MTSTVEDCILSFDSVIRVGGTVADDDSDESERVQTVLNSASEKFGVHFECQEARVLEDRNGNYFGSSLPIVFKRSFAIGEKMSINHHIARHTSDSHYCIVPGCKDPCIKSSENKFSNGQTHIKRHHPEFIPLSMWTGDMLSKREAVWTEQYVGCVSG